MTLDLPGLTSDVGEGGCVGVDTVTVEQEWHIYDTNGRNAPFVVTTPSTTVLLHN